MKKILLIALSFMSFSLYAENDSNVFLINQPDKELSPLTGMTREHWFDAAEYLLEGAFSYIHSLDDAMKFPKQHDKTYPRNESQVTVEKLEGISRTLFVATPLLKRNSDLVMNNIKVADYYRYQILQLTNPENAAYIPHRGSRGASQTLVEFGALAISLSLIPEVIWEPFTQKEKDALASLMLSYGEGPTIDSNWRFFNIFVMSFFKNQGYEIKEEVLIENLNKALAFYRGQGWYNDAPAYDYYSMWAFQMYGTVWAQLFGKKYYPQYAEKFMNNLADMVDNYPYMFNRDGHMNMWGRSIPYRFAAVVPLALTGMFTNSNVNYGWFRRISSSTLLQFLQNPEFLEDHVPTLGFYGAFEPATQIYSCRGSVYWSGKVFLPLCLLPEDNIFWMAVENNGPWENQLKKGHVYNKFQEATNLMITDYPNSGAAEMRSWCHETVAKDWQKFRSSENYNKLVYNTDFPWMADGKDGEVSMNYAVKNAKNEWEVLRLYTFKSFENGIYRRDAVLETNPDMIWQLTDIPLPDGILRVDKVTTPVSTDIRLGHYSLPELNEIIISKQQKINGQTIHILSNDEYQLVQIPLAGWKSNEVLYPEHLHPISYKCAVPIVTDKIDNEKIYVTLQLWKKGNKNFSKKELSPVKEVKISDDKKMVEILFGENTKKTIQFD